jgi:hypothetical protein
LWSPAISERCPRPDLERANDDERCPVAMPVPDSPCEPASLMCPYEKCWTDEPTIQMICDCGRWVFDDLGCPTIP